MEHVYHIYLAWIRTKNTKLLKGYVGIYGPTTTTTFIYKLHRDGNDLKGGIFSM